MTHVNGSDLRGVTNWSSGGPDLKHSAIESSAWQHLESGIARLLTSPLHSLYRPSKNTRRHIFVVIIIIIIIGYLLFLKAENTNITVEFYTRQMAGKRLSVGTLSDKWHNICDVPAHSIVIQSMQLTWTGFVTAASALQCPRESNLWCAVFYVWFIALFTKQFLYIDYV